MNKFYESVMDGKFFTSLAKYLDEIELYPYFNICHYLLISIQVRQLAPGAKTFSRVHPLSSWVSTMLLCFAGSLISNLLIGEPLVIPLKYHENMLHASICWYVVNYFPFDLCYTVATFLPVYLTMSLAKELFRCRMVSVGIAVAAKRFPDSLLVWLLIGMGKGCGEDIMLPVAQACMGTLSTSNLFVLYPTFNVKGSLAVAFMFTLEKMQKVPLASTQLFLAALMFLTYFRVSSLIVGIKDPFLPFENIVCGLFLGGLVDSIKRVLSQQKTVHYPTPGAAAATTSGGSPTGSYDEEEDDLDNEVDEDGVDECTDNGQVTRTSPKGDSSKYDSIPPVPAATSTAPPGGKSHVKKRK